MSGISHEQGVDPESISDQTSVAFTIEGRTPADKIIRINQIAMAAASVTGEAVILTASEIPAASPSILLDWVCTDVDTSKYELAVTRDCLVDFSEAEFDSPGLGNSIYESVAAHYRGLHDVLLRSRHKYHGKLLSDIQPKCDCPLEAVRSPLISWGIEGFRPYSFIACVEEGVKFRNVGVKRHRVLKAAAESLRAAYADASRGVMVRYDDLTDK